MLSIILLLGLISGARCSAQEKTDNSFEENMDADTLYPSAYPYNYQNNNIENFTAESYRIDFVEGIKYNSNNVNNIINAFSGILDEIVFSVNAGDDTFTIGYYLGDEAHSFLDIISEIEKTVEELNRDIIVEERISSNNHLSLDALELKYCIVVSNSNLNNASSLFGVKTVRRITTTSTVTNLSRHDAISSRLERNNTINGSYHHVEVIDDDAYVCWYNQLTGTHNHCSLSPSSPHAGDGNNRYASGYQWFPNRVDVNFYTDVATNENRTKLWYKYDQSTLNNLNVDYNEALEMEVAFYNYYGATVSYNNKGNAFQLIKSGAVWATNQPNSYRDTNFGDGNNIVTFCVGVDDTSDLVAGQWYFWYINGTKGTTANNYPNDGRFRVTAQRSYRVMGSGTWSVYAEEHEGIRILGLNSNQNWVPANQNAWILAAANDDWNFNSSTDPVK